MTVKALLRAYDDGNDIITLSLGHVDSWTTGTSSVVASRIAASGRVVTASAGMFSCDFYIFHENLMV